MSNPVPLSLLLKWKFGSNNVLNMHFKNVALEFIILQIFKHFIEKGGTVGCLPADSGFRTNCSFGVKATGAM